MIKTIVFDIGNVLARFGWREYLQSCDYEEKLVQRIGCATVESPLWKEWDRGAKDMKEVIELCRRRDPGVVKEINHFFDNLLSVVTEYDYSEMLVKQLKDNGYRIYLLSNYSKWSFENNKKDFRFAKYIDGEVISYQIKHVKPEAEIYEALINKYTIDPKEAVFIDDIEENIQGAVPFGFHTIQFYNYDQALEELRRLGVRI